MASHRIGARVAGLSPAQLCAIIEAQAAAGGATPRCAWRRSTPARLVEQPEWVLSEVLLSPDLAPHILAQLPTKEHAAKGTCRVWRRGWKETLKKRERQRMVVIGGEDSDDGRLVNSLERYDPSTNEWEEEAVAPMPTARRYAGTAMLDGKLYVVGGQGAGFNSLLSVERYDFATNAWEAVAPMATPRETHAMAALDGKLYAVGGYNRDDNNDDGYLSSVERYDPVTNAWEAVAPMATARQEHAVAVLDGKLYAVGGYDGGCLSSVERYDPATNAWEEVAPMAAARDCHVMAVLDGKLYAVGGNGGFNNGDPSSVERYDPALDAWEVVAPMAEARYKLAVAVLDGKLYVVGGEIDGDFLSSVERYDPAANTWEAVAPLATARAYPVAVLM